MSFSPCAVVPVFNHHDCLPRIVAALMAHDLPCILVDDGSDEPTRLVLARLEEEHPQVETLTLEENQGKGVAVLAGIALADARGYTHALQIDADGQHDTDDVPTLIALARQHPGDLVSGMPVYDDSVPAIRFYGRYLTHALIWLDTLSLQLRDSMCGFRVYPVAATLSLASRQRIGARMDFDTDIMTRLYWDGVECRFVPTRVRYPEEGTSHYRMVRDNLRMTWLHLRLFAGMIPRAPRLLGRSLARGRAQHWARIGERGSLAGLRFIGFIDRALGRRAALAVLYPVTAWFFILQPRARRASASFLARAGASTSPANQFRHLLQFAVSILDKVAAWRDPESVPVTWEARETLIRAVAGGRGVLLLSAHLGNLELARAAASQIPGLRINALVYSSNSRKIKAMLELTSDDSGLNLIEVDSIGADTACLLREKIDAGEVVVIVGDRIPVSDDSPVIEADFLGAPASFAVGPYVLAHVLECPVHLLFCLEEQGRYRAYLEPFAERVSLPRTERNAVAAVWAARYAKRLGDYARRFPLQWYNFYDFWAENRAAAEGREASPLDPLPQGKG